MGAGASATGAATGSAKGSRAAPSQATLTATGTTTVVDVVEGGVQWLAGIVDREKQEKEWIAARFEEKCTEVNELHKEIHALRAELELARRGGAAPGAADTGRTSPVSPSSTLLVKAPEVAAPVMSSPSNAGGRSDDQKSAGGGSGGLMARRGMKLGIDTSKQNRASAADRPAVMLPKEVVSPVQEKPHEEAAAMAEAAEKEEAGPPPMVERRGSNAGEEPMSALLRRRAEDWSTTSYKSESTKVAKEEEKVVLLDPSASVKNLQITSNKVFSMFEDCPASPKRALKGGRGHFPEAPLPEGTGGSGGTG